MLLVKLTSWRAKGIGLKALVFPPTRNSVDYGDHRKIVVKYQQSAQKGWCSGAGGAGEPGKAVGCTKLNVN